MQLGRDLAVGRAAGHPAKDFELAGGELFEGPSRDGRRRRSVACSRKNSRQHAGIEPGTPGRDCPDGGVYRGRIGCLDFFENYLSAWDWYCFHVLQAVDLDDHQVLVEAEEFGRTSGLDLRRKHWQVWNFENGLVTGWAVFGQLDDAVASLDGAEA